MPSVSMLASRVDILGAYEGRRGVKNRACASNLSERRSAVGTRKRERDDPWDADYQIGVDRYGSQHG